MKVEKTVVTETAFVAICVVVCSAVMQGVFLAIGQWNLPVLYGNILSGCIGILNFFLLGITVQHAVHQEVKTAKRTMRISMLLRYLMLVAVAVLGAVFDVFNLYSTLIALLFPRVGITIRQFALKKNDKTEPASTVEDADINDSDDAETGEEAEGEDNKIDGNSNSDISDIDEGLL
jgi:predicted membrane protein